MTTPNPSKFWLDQAAEEIIQRYPSGEIIISSGHSPSGIYHIGTIREMATASALTWAVRQRGRDAKHLDFVDDFDILRKLPVDLPESLRVELGKPVSLAASPEAGVSYGEYFYRDLISAAKTTGFYADETLFARNTYLKEHRYTEAITKALDKLATAKQLIETISHRQLPPTWGPVQILSDNDRLNEWIYSGHDTERQIVRYRTADGEEGEISYAEGRVKLDWRLDWPARWWMWGINVEPFGRDHATKGGSYDTGSAIVREIFGGEPPMPVPYEFINALGKTKKMSKSEGNVITPADALDVMPAEAVRYFIVRSRPDRQLIFDAGLGLYNLLDEFAMAGADPNHLFRDAYDFAVAGGAKQVLSTVPFKHLVQVYQAAQGNVEETLDILKRTGHAEKVAAEHELIVGELSFVKNWLNKYAPEEVIFSVQQNIPELHLEDDQKAFMSSLAVAIEQHAGVVDGQTMHELIYAARDEIDLPAAVAFKALYQSILAKPAGPKAGWFLASLDKEWLVKRLRLEA